MKSLDSLVTRWLSVTCLLFIIQRNSRNMFKRHYLKNPKSFLQFLFHFPIVHKIYCILKERMSFIPQIFRKLLTSRNIVTWMPESSGFRTPVESQRGHGWQTLLKSACQHFHLNFPLTQDELSSKTFLLVRCEILALFGNTLTAADMDSCHNSEKFQRHAQTGLSQKS